MIMRIINFVYIIIAGALISTNCENNCKDYEGTFDSALPFFDLNTPYAWLQNIDESESVVNIVIYNQQDYEKYIAIRSDTLRPVIDFEKYTLLAGRAIHPTCGFIKNQKVIKKCSDYYFTVILNSGICGAGVTVDYFVVIAKTYSEIKFDIRFEN